MKGVVPWDAGGGLKGIFLLGEEHGKDEVDGLVGWLTEEIYAEDGGKLEEWFGGYRSHWDLSANFNGGV